MEHLKWNVYCPKHYYRHGHPFQTQSVLTEQDDDTELFREVGVMMERLDSTSSLPATFESCLVINRAYQEIIKEHITRIELELAENREAQVGHTSDCIAVHVWSTHMSEYIAAHIWSTHMSECIVAHIWSTHMSECIVAHIWSTRMSECIVAHICSTCMSRVYCCACQITCHGLLASHVGVYYYIHQLSGLDYIWP